MSDETFTWDYNAPLARCKGESRRANDALCDYYLMGSGRSLRKLLERYRGQAGDGPGTVEPPTRRWATLSSWSVRNEWQARIDRQKELDDEQEKQKWEQRRHEVREADWELGDELRKRAAQYLQDLQSFRRTSMKEVEGDDGEKVKVITLKSNVTLPHISGASRVASDLQRQAAEVPPPAQRHEITGQDGGPITHKREADWSELNDDDLDQLIHNLQAATGLGAVGEAPPATKPADPGDEPGSDAGAA